MLPGLRPTGLSLLALLFSAAVAAAESAPLALAWQVSPLVLPGRFFPALLGQPVAELRLLAVQAGVWQPIPFQVDCRGADGEYVLAAFQPAPAPDDPCGRLREND